MKKPIKMSPEATRLLVAFEKTSESYYKKVYTNDTRCDEAKTAMLMARFALEQHLIRTGRMAQRLTALIRHRTPR